MIAKAVGALVAVVIAASCPRPAAGAPTVHAGGGLGEDTIWVRGGTPGGDELVTAGDRPASSSRFVSKRLVSGSCYFPIGGGDPVVRPMPGAFPHVAAGARGSSSEVGLYYFDSIVDVQTGDTVAFRGGCLRPGESPPPPIPDPPSPEEVSAEARLPQPGIGLSPEVPATGMETYLWANGAVGETTVSVTIRGWTAQATARPVRFVWMMGDGRTRTSTTPGSACHEPACRALAAVRHTYETKGDYRVELAVVWSGEFTLSGHGIAVGVQDLGSAVARTSARIHVREIRSVLTE